MYGRTTSLKTNYMIDNKEVQAYLKKLQKTDPTDAKKWKNAFNAKGSVDNKQDYFDLLVNYIQKQTNYGTLAQEYANTFQGQVSRIKGYWEILRADLLGVDRETGEIKVGSLFDSVKQGLSELQDWLKKSDTQDMLSKIGQGLGEASRTVLKSFEDLLNKIDWKKLGDIIQKIGNTIANFLTRLNDNGTLDKLLDSLPKLAEKAINNQVLDTQNKVIVGNDVANGNWFDAGIHNIYGWTTRQESNLGMISTDQASHLYDYSGSNNKSLINQWWDNLWKRPDYDSISLSDSNASDILSQNANLTDDDKNTIENMMQNDSTAVYNITIGEIKADNVEDIIASLQKYQTNQK
jgi:hypothetical protein